ncbi:sensor histidine kinase [Streptomyces malaysiense]|uniref:histidine kinase n=1 Tax=Streptomyces malaysiense TaxID=1428626 RepID=A0A1J4QAW9_9ACTN|nr:histidine kinase [Streptomyces malaysiense]OIK29620.1 two-component sensor histidine kinase [Streptomyces malaysiense]
MTTLPSAPAAPAVTEELGAMGPLVARLGRAGRRLRGADRDRPWALDTAVVAAVFLMFCLPDLLHGGVVDADGPRRFRLAFTRLPLAAVLAAQAGLVLPLLWRRRRPATAFVVVAAVFVLQWAIGAALHADVALFLALYSLALHGRPRRIPWACAVMAAALALVAVRVSAVVSVADALFFLLSTATAALALGLAIRIRRAQLAALRDRAARLETERDQRSRLAAASERARVAREMHDIVGHHLSVVITLADAGVCATAADAGRGAEALALIGDTGRQALGELRRVLGVLRDTDASPACPELSPQPGLADLDALCHGVRAAGLDVVYRTAGKVEALDEGVQLTVYRIVQEAMTNTLKHAGAGTRVDLAIDVGEGRLGIQVRDTGRYVRAGRRGDGQGLPGMRERVALYGGRLSAGPAPGGGWIVAATLDLGPREGAA